LDDPSWCGAGAFARQPQTLASTSSKEIHKNHPVLEGVVSGIDRMQFVSE